MRTTLVGFLAVGLSLGALACSDSGGSSGGGGGGHTTWAGLVEGSDGVESGSLGIAVLTTSPSVVGAGNGIALAPGDVTAAAVYNRNAPTQATVNLSGTYNPADNTLTVSGSGYTFTGTFDGQSRLDGTFTGPTTNGTFVSLEGAELAEAFCGTYSGGDSGTWSFIVQGTALRGQAQSTTEGSPLSLQGVVGRGNSLTFYVAGTQQQMGTGTIATQPDLTPIADGTWSQPGTQVSGTWEATQCQVPQ
jgi:hypothetical protein